MNIINNKNKLFIQVATLSKRIYHEYGDYIFTSGISGDIGIIYGHLPLLTYLRPGPLKIVNNNNYELFYISGGILEIQPSIISIMADNIIHVKDLNEDEIINSKNLSEQKMLNMTDHNSNINKLIIKDYNIAIAKIRVLELELAKDIK